MGKARHLALAASAAIAIAAAAPAAQASITIVPGSEFSSAASDVPGAGIVINQKNFDGSNVGFSGYFTAGTIPEASTWAMMLLGLAGLGYAGFRRRKAAISIV